MRIYADLDNPDHELKPGYKAVMTIALKPETGVSYTSSRRPAIGPRTRPRVSAPGSLELPAAAPMKEFPGRARLKDRLNDP